MKALLKAMDKEEIITFVLELYSSKPEAKEYLDFFVAPNETEVLNKYKQIIAYEFYPEEVGKMRKFVFLCVAKHCLISRNWNLQARLLWSWWYFTWKTLANLLMTTGDMWEQFYDSVEKNFEKTLQEIVANDLWKDYDARIQQCLK